LIAIYIAYSWIFLFLTLAVSANVRTAQTALVAMVGFWAVSSFVLPRAASDVSRLLYPTPTAVAFQANIYEAMQSGLNGVSPDTVIQQRQQQMLALYNAETVEELPINFQGMIFDLQEKLGNEVFDKFYGELHAIFDQQTGLHQMFSIGSPRMATQLASMELSGTSLGHHTEFTRQAEQYRRELIEGMNRDITFNSESGQADYRAGPELWASIEPFAYEPPSLGALLTRLGPSFMVMFLWLALSIVAGVLAVRKVKVTLG
jgi:ABC-2 type transport system permease protein